MPKRILWAYGVTTVPRRRAVLLPQTLRSLATGGFPSPVLFVDGIDHAGALDYEQEFKLPVVNRWPVIKTFGNWILALAELYIRNPTADRYAIFQDDFVTSIGLREYLDSCQFPDGSAAAGGIRGYWNLYTFDENLRLVPRDQTQNRNMRVGWFVSTQRGLGAVGLVFDREGVWDLLSEKGHITTRPAHAGHRSWTNIDGGIVDAMKKRGYKELVHYPSLLQHKGIVTTMRSHRHSEARTFKGETFDLRTLTKK